MYLLRKSGFERIALFCLFIASCITLLSYIEYEEWIIATRTQVDIVSIQNDIFALAENYEIKSKCKKLICTNKELQHMRLQAILPYTKHHYTLFFVCNSVLCYDFIQALESLPTLFIHEISSSNVTIIQDSTHNEYDVQWKQDIRIVFSVGAYQV